MPEPTCSVAGCTREARTRGWCSKHYHRWRTNGDPVLTKYEINRLQRLAQRSASEPSRHVCSDCDVTYERAKTYTRPNGPWCDECRRKRRVRLTLARNIKHMYGITLDEYEAMQLAQQGKCAICDANQSPGGRPLQVDHSHSTGKVRALLCSNCNTGIGVFLESSDLLGRAIAYLDEHQSL